jgi:ribosomal-protein-serine acetyltransferase
MTPEPKLELPGGRMLRPLEESDASELHTLIEANRAHLAPWMPWAAGQTAERTLDFIRSTRRQRADDDGFQAALISRGRIVGVAGYHGIDRPNRATSLGYWLAEAEQGRGTMTQAVGVLVGHAFGAWRLNRVEIRADVENLRSRAIPERLGFRREGTLREVLRLGDGYRDQVVYGLLAEDWNEMRLDGMPLDGMPLDGMPLDAVRPRR